MAFRHTRQWEKLSQVLRQGLLTLLLILVYVAAQLRGQLSKLLRPSLLSAVYWIAQLKRKSVPSVSLALFSLVLIVFSLAKLHFAWDTQPVSAMLKAPPAPVLLSTPTRVMTFDSFTQALLGLRELYKTAPQISIEQLEADEYGGGDLSLPKELPESTAPRQYRLPVHPSNFGDRFKKDLQGLPVHNKLLIVLHETTSQSAGAVNEMLTEHSQDQDQVSYHTIIRKDGTILYLVDPIKRAYGAGDSVFKGSEGAETVKTKMSLPSSVNNFSYHISLETPSDGYNSDPQHSGYSDRQYKSLAWLIAHSEVERNRITTHVAVDQSGQRQDPRSFNMAKLQDNPALKNSPIAQNLAPKVS